MQKKIENISLQELQLHCQELARQLYQACESHHKIVTTAESCTGGLVSAYITDIPGSSAMFDRAFVTYSNVAKQDMIQVNEQTLSREGAVSETVAIEMLQGALDNSLANIGISITGIAGPGGGSEAKPVGTVCFAWGNKLKQLSSTEHFNGSRKVIRLKATSFALTQLISFVNAQVK